MARTRDPGVDRAIHVAALGLLAARGLSGVTIEDVAARAKVARTTVYRRYDNVPDMVAAAVDDLLGLPVPDSGLEARDAWRHMVLSLREALFESEMGLPLLAALIVAEREHPELLEMWRERVVAPRVEMIGGVLGWSGADAALLGQLAFGGLIARHVAQGAVDESEAATLADRLWDGLSPHHQ